MLRAANLAPHPKFAIRSTFVRRTIVEQMTANRVAALRCAPSMHLHKYAAFFSQASRVKQRGAPNRARFQRCAPHARVGTSIAFIISSQRRLRFAGLF
jgi:hypothetical protein